MVENPFDIKYIYTRTRLLERSKSITESAKIPDLFGKHNSNFYKVKLESFLQDCSSYKDAIFVLESLYNQNKSDLVDIAVQRINNEILPSLKHECLEECKSMIETAMFGDNIKSKFIQTINDCKTADRIKTNHKILNESFDFSTLRRLSDREKCFKICEVVDTCNSKKSKYINFNVALEETIYLNNRNGYSMSIGTIIENVLDYYMMKDDNSQSDIDSYKKALYNSRVLTNESADVINRYFNPRKAKNIKNEIANWKLIPGNKLKILIDSSIDKEYGIESVNSIIETIQEYCKINHLEEYDSNIIYSIFESNIKTSTDAKKFLKLLSNQSNTKSIIDKVKLVLESRLSNESYYCDSSKDTLTSDQISSLKFNNILDDSKTVDSFLDKFEKSSKKYPVKLKRVVSFDPRKEIEESSILDYVDADEHISLTIRSYCCENMTDDFIDYLNSSIKSLNNTTLYNRDSRAYYNLSENCFDVCLRSKYHVLLTEQEELNKGFSSYEKFNIVKLNKYLIEMENIYRSDLFNIMDRLSNDRSLAKSISVDEASLLCEMLMPFNETSSQNGGFLDEFVYLCEESGNKNAKSIRSIYKSMDKEKFCYSSNDFNLARINLASNVLVEADNNRQNKNNQSNNQQNKSKKDQQNKNNQNINQQHIEQNVNAVESKSSGGIFGIKSLNDIKLIWQGIKSKIFGTEDKLNNTARDMDLTFNHLFRTVSHAADGGLFGRRENIITGEVTYSLSKAVKLAIAGIMSGAAIKGAGTLAGVSAGVASGAAIVTPILGLVGLYARSKYLSRQEKMRILDEIDIELKIIDRELNNIDKNDTVRYRQLLTLKKNLERRRYSIAAGIGRNTYIPTGNNNQ